jgi:hypothetical protein
MISFPFFPSHLWLILSACQGFDDALAKLDVELVKGSFSIAVAVIVLTGVYFTARNAMAMNEATVRASTEATSKTVFVESITKERGQWRQDLRNATADLGCTLQRLLSSGDDHLPDFQRHRISVRLRLNPIGGEKNRLDQNIMDGLDRLQELLAVTRRRRQRTAIEGEMSEIEKNVQALLKQEWQKSKNEALAGKLTDEAPLEEEGNAAAAAGIGQ